MDKTSQEKVAYLVQELKKIARADFYVDPKGVTSRTLPAPTSAAKKLFSGSPKGKIKTLGRALRKVVTRGR